MTLLHVPLRELPRPSLRAHGDELNWAALIPSAWAALADPDGVHLWPEFPPAGEFAAAWFTPAMHLLTYAAGWPRLDLGASWWHGAGYPVEEPVLAVVDDMLGDRRDELMAWLLTSMTPGDLPSEIAAATGTALPTATRPNLDTAWLTAVEQNLRAYSAYVPGDGDPLHLSHHTMAPIHGQNDDVRVTWLPGPRTNRRGILIVDGYAGWYRTLAHLGSSLPAVPGDRSWRVDVICTPLGHLGTYRRSRLTGRWFSTRHRVHQAGWAEP